MVFEDEMLLCPVSPFQDFLRRLQCPLKEEELLIRYIGRFAAKGN